MQETNKNEPKTATVDLGAEAVETAVLHLEQAKSGLAKLPILGPAMWLFGRDPVRKFTFIADMDWQLLPPVILEQCKLYTKNEIPVAFFTWAFVNDEIDQRLRAGIPRLAPHEWKSGSHLWLIDIVSPFTAADETLKLLLSQELSGQSANALLPNPHQGGALSVHTWPAQTSPQNPVA